MDGYIKPFCWWGKGELNEIVIEEEKTERYIDRYIDDNRDSDRDRVRKRRERER